MALDLESFPLLISQVLDAESYCTKCNNYLRVGRTVLNAKHLSPCFIPTLSQRWGHGGPRKLRNLHISPAVLPAYVLSATPCHTKEHWEPFLLFFAKRKLLLYAVLLHWVNLAQICHFFQTPTNALHSCPIFNSSEHSKINWPFKFDDSDLIL